MLLASAQASLNLSLMFRRRCRRCRWSTPTAPCLASLAWLQTARDLFQSPRVSRKPSLYDKSAPACADGLQVSHASLQCAVSYTLPPGSTSNETWTAFAYQVCVHPLRSLSTRSFRQRFAFRRRPILPTSRFARSSAARRAARHSHVSTTPRWFNSQRCFGSVVLSQHAVGDGVSVGFGRRSRPEQHVAAVSHAGCQRRPSNVNCMHAVTQRCCAGRVS